MWAGAGHCPRDVRRFPCTQHGDRCLFEGRLEPSRYWDRARTITDRYHNFDIEAHLQVVISSSVTPTDRDELLRNHGKVNVPGLTQDGSANPMSRSILDQIAGSMLASSNPIFWSWTVPRVNGNYRTPEQEVPEDIVSTLGNVHHNDLRGWYHLLKN